MGSMAYYSAGVKVVYPRKLKVATANTDSEIQAFLDSKKGVFGKYIDITEEDVTEENLENGTYLGYWGDTGYDDEDGIDEAWSVKELTEGFFMHSLEDFDELKGVVQVKPEDLKFLDLKILKDYKAIPVNGSVDIEISLANESGYIYCDNDNSTGGKIKIKPEILQDLLDKKCYLYLDADGSGEHC